MQDSDAMHLLLLSPMTWVLLLGAVLCLGWRRMGPALRAAGLVLGVAVLLLCTPLGGNALIRFVETRVPEGQRCNAAQALDGTMPVVVLAGGLDGEPASDDDYAALTQPSWRRLRGAVSMWQATPQSTLVIAGGGPFGTKEALVLSHLARDWHVPASNIRTELASTNTWESAVALRGTLPTRIRLVTSATHLPRAMQAFSAAGFQACGHASDSDYVPMGSVGYFLPQLSAMEKTQAAVYELVGMARYRLRE